MSKIIDTLKKVGEKITPDVLSHKHQSTVDLPLPVQLQSVVIEEYNRNINLLEENIRQYTTALETMKRNVVTRLLRKGVGIFIEFIWYALCVGMIVLDFIFVYPLLTLIGSGAYLANLVGHIQFAGFVVNLLSLTAFLIPLSFLCIGLIFRKIRKKNNQIVELLNTLQTIISDHQNQLEHAKAFRSRIINSITPGPTTNVVTNLKNE